MRKTLIVIATILAIAAIGIGVYFGWQRSREILNPPTVGQKPFIDNQKFATTTGQGKGSGEVEAEAVAQLRILSTEPVFDYWLSSQNFGTTSANLATATGSAPNVFYLSLEGKIYGISLSQKNIGNTLISAETKENLQSIKASPDGRMLLLKYGDLMSPTFSIFDAKSNVYQKLPNASAGAFSPDGKQIAYLDNGTPANLIVKDLVGARQKTTRIISINARDFDLTWNNPGKILLASRPSGLYDGQLWSLDLKTKTLSLLSSERGLAVNWSKDGKLGLKLKNSDGHSANLSLIDDKGKVLGGLDFSTLPQKCGWSEPKIYPPTKTATTTHPYSEMALYCALPQFYNTPTEPVLPDDYLKRAVYFSDFLYRIDLEQNAIEALYVDSNNPIDADKLTFSGKKLFFINRYDDKLYELELP